MSKGAASFTDAEALLFHKTGRPGKLEIIASKPMATQRDLSLAYSPGVAVPVLAISRDPSCAYDYTGKGNLVAVISNGSATLGLGNLGALASKPVMEGKAALFKRFADVDSIDLEVDTTDIEAFIECVRYLGPSFGGINLEDIRAPDCFIIEERLRQLMPIPVFHDDQHGTAIITAAGLINALDITGRQINQTKIVCNGAGSAGIACLQLICSMGVAVENVTLCDREGVIYVGRAGGDSPMNQWKSAYARDTKDRTLADAMRGADVFLGLSVEGAVTPEMVKSMARDPIIFAMANPNPEIRPEIVAEVRDDAIMATGRSDYPNQINNVLGFPYIFRGALDIRATTINEAMKIAAVEALAALAREDVPDEVAIAYKSKRPRYGRDYIIPAPFDPRLIEFVPSAVAAAAMKSGVAGRPIEDFDAYRAQLRGRLDPSADFLQNIFTEVRRRPKHIVFAEGEEEAVIRAAIAYHNNGFGNVTLVGRSQTIHRVVDHGGIELPKGVDIYDTEETSYDSQPYVDYLYRRLRREGFLLRDCRRLIYTDRNVVASCMLALGEVDAMVSGTTRHSSVVLDTVKQVFGSAPGKRIIGAAVVLARGRTVFIADTTIHPMPDARALADIAEQTAALAQRFGHQPRVAFLAYATFGQPREDRSQLMRQAVEILDTRQVDFEYEGEMAPNVALDAEAMRLYPFCRLSGPANVLIMPSIHSASIATHILSQLGGGTVIGPLVAGLSRSVQIVSLNAPTSEILNLSALAAYDLSLLPTMTREAEKAAMGITST